MANLQFIGNVTHNGMLFLGQQIEDNRVVFDGMVVDLDADTRGLKDVAESLCDRGLARITNAPATHTSNFVDPNGSQTALPVDAPSGTGSAPAADALRQREALQSRAQPQAPAQPAAPAAAAAADATPAPAASTQPSAEEVAAAAAAVN